MTAFTACCLIALDKCPGVWPISVGEVVQRIVGKAILSMIGVEIQQSAGSLHLCAGQPSGCEADIHALRHIFDDVSTQAALLVDASNAFNKIVSLICVHKENWWLACVFEVCSDTKEVKLTFLHPHGPLNSVKYPEPQNIHTTPMDDILTLVGPRTRSGRVYSLTKKK